MRQVVMISAREYGGLGKCPKHFVQIMFAIETAVDGVFKIIRVLELPNFDNTERPLEPLCKLFYPFRTITLHRW